MSRLNRPATAYAGTTREGAPAIRLTPLQTLRRTVLSCLLWEKNFYENGESIADRIVTLASKVPVADLADLAIEAREQMKLRHTPLLLTSCLAREQSRARNEYGRVLVSETIARVIRRADELCEFLAIHANLNGVSTDEIKPTLSNPMRIGLANAFGKFDEYQLSKWDQGGEIKLRDVLFLCHAKPRDDEQKALWERLMAGTLRTPDTWETRLSSGQDKKQSFETLLGLNRLGYMALLMNLRNMAEAGVDNALVEKAILARKGAHNVLPFRYVAAARACPRFEPALDKALIASIEEMPGWEGTTFVLVDVSASMNYPLSAKSDMTRMIAAATLASIVPGDVRTFSFSERVVEVPPRRGMAGVDAIIGSQRHYCTYLGKAIGDLNANMKPDDRLIVVTDEQSNDHVGSPISKRAYMINVSTDERGVGHHQHWTRISGFSEAILRYISQAEGEYVE